MVYAFVHRLVTDPNGESRVQMALAFQALALLAFF